MEAAKSLKVNSVKNKSKTSSTKNTISKVKEITYTILIYAELIFMCFIVLFPVVWIVGSSFNEGTSLAGATPIPANPTTALLLNIPPVNLKIPLFPRLFA